MLINYKDAKLKYLLLIWLLAFSLATSACEKIKIAHAALLKSTFTVQKNFVLNMDNEDKVKLNSVIEYHDGVLNRSQEEIIFIAADFKYGEDEREPFLLSGFTCANIEIKGQQVVISMAVDDKTFTSFFQHV